MNFIYEFLFNKFAWGLVSFKKSAAHLDTVCNFHFSHINKSVKQKQKKLCDF